MKEKKVVREKWFRDEPLSKAEIDFVEKYIDNGYDQYAAYKEAGFAGTRADAFDLLQKNNVKHYYNALLRNMKDVDVMELSEILQHLTQIGRGKGKQTKTVLYQGQFVSTETPIELSMRLKALEMMLGLYTNGKLQADKEKIEKDFNIKISLNGKDE